MLLLNHAIGPIQFLSALGKLTLESLNDLLRFLINVVKILKLVLADAGHLFLHLKYLGPLLRPTLRCQLLLCY
jgi:hypothetical protein